MYSLARSKSSRIFVGVDRAHWTYAGQQPAPLTASSSWSLEHGMSLSELPSSWRSVGASATGPAALIGCEPAISWQDRLAFTRRCLISLVGLRPRRDQPSLGPLS